VDLFTAIYATHVDECAYVSRRHVSYEKNEKVDEYEESRTSNDDWSPTVSNQIGIYGLL